MKKINLALTDFLQQRPKAGPAFRLVRLWRNWERAVGPEIAGLAKPLGHSKSTLLIGVEDSSGLQEVFFLGPEMIERCNSFLEEIFFDKVRAELLMGKTPLNEIRVETGQVIKAEPPKPKQLGALFGKMRPDSAATRAYKAYVDFFSERR